MKISEIARRTGFASAKQLTMAFHHWQGMSPRAYRRLVQGTEDGPASGNNRVPGSMPPGEARHMSKLR
jgi:AraC-like DNA-binding protein